jgi:hypothetical protein
VPPSSVMNSRRLTQSIAFLPHGGTIGGRRK